MLTCFVGTCLDGGSPELWARLCAYVLTCFVGAKLGVRACLHNPRQHLWIAACFIHVRVGATFGQPQRNARLAGGTLGTRARIRTFWSQSASCRAHQHSHTRLAKDRRYAAGTCTCRPCDRPAVKYARRGQQDCRSMPVPDFPETREAFASDVHTTTRTQYQNRTCNLLHCRCPTRTGGAKDQSRNSRALRSMLCTAARVLLIAGKIKQLGLAKWVTSQAQMLYASEHDEVGPCCKLVFTQKAARVSATSSSD